MISPQGFSNNGSSPISEKMIRRLAPKNIVERGWQYYKLGRVTEFLVEGCEVFAQVDGARTYTVNIGFYDDAIEKICTCPYDRGETCKHVIAVLYRYLDQLHLQGAGTEEDIPQEEEGEEHQGSNGKIYKWTRKFEKLLLQPREEQFPQTSQPPWKLIYVIVREAFSLRLTACRQKLRKDGTGMEPTVLLSCDLQDDAHFDDTDKLVIPHLIPNGGLSIWNHEQALYSTSRVSKTPPSPLFSTILQHLENKEVYLADYSMRTLTRIQVSSDPLELSFFLQEGEQEDIVTARLHKSDVDVVLVHPLEPLIAEPLWILSGTNLYRTSGVDQSVLEYLDSVSWKVQIPIEGRAQFRGQTLPRILERFRVHGDCIAVQKMENGLARRLYLEEHASLLHVKLRCAYHGYEVSPDTNQPHLVVPADDLRTYYWIERDRNAEAQARRDVLDTYMSETALNEFLPRQLSLDWIIQKLPLLVSQGFEVYGKEKLKSFRVRTGATMNVAVSSGIDWFDLNINVTYDDVSAPWKDLYHSIQRGDRFVKLADGTLGLIPEEWMKKFKRAFALTEAKGSEWKLSHGHFSLIDQLFNERELQQFDTTFERYRKQFKQFESIRSSPVPQEFYGELRPYQKSGYDWLQFLKEFHFNGCLADDMGLGKTVQALALLQHEHGNGAHTPSLIVVPTSIVFNWMNEAKRFTTTLDVLCHTGNKRFRSQEEILGHDIIVTSYGTLRKDIALLKDIMFHYVILDESQNIKNAGSQNAKAVKLLKAHHKLVLTGTPIENNLLELWSQFDFLNPGLLGSRNSFREQFIRPIEKNKDEETAVMLRKMIYPFILRRTKEVVAKDLPPKTELIKYCEMEKPQRTLYNHWREHYRSAILDSIQTVGLQQSKFKVLEGLMRLRQICCHPHLVEERYSGASGKYELWKEMVQELLAENHKVLVFSQFVKMLRVLADYCDSIDVDYEYLDGQTRDREERVTRFQENDSVKAFLISLKAGGTGLNLTAADYVIHYDPWWNPAVEMQATDRTHRIGQTKSVFSYKLITKDTIEEKILLLQEKKKELVQSIITAETGIMKKITKEDIEMLFT